MIPVYVINLDRRPDRWAVMAEQLDRLGIEAERIPAVDGRNLSDRDRRFGPYGRLLLPAVGCCRSHAAAMRRLLATDAPAALVLEDDIELAEDTPDMLRSVDWWPGSANIIRLEHTFTDRVGELIKTWLRKSVEGTTPTSRGLHRIEFWVGGSGAYLIDRAGAKAALGPLQAPRQPADHILFDQPQSRTARKLATFQIVPAMARQRDPWEESDIQWQPDPKLLVRGRRLLALPSRAKLKLNRVRGLVHRHGVAYAKRPDGGNADARIA